VGGLTNWLGQDHIRHIAYYNDVEQVIDCYMSASQPPSWDHETAWPPAPPLETGGNGALTNWLSFPDLLQHIGFVDDDGVEDLYTESNSTSRPWGIYNVTNDTGPPTALRDALTSWWSDSDHTQHIVYISDGRHVEEVWVVPGVRPWQIRDVTDDIGASSGNGKWAQAGALTTWWSTVDGLRHIAYIDQRGHIQDCYMQPGKYPWRNYDVTEDTGPPTAQPGALTSWWFDGDDTQHVAYIDDTTNIQEAFVQPNAPPWKIRPVL
jgi:hypothetical protein